MSKNNNESNERINVYPLLPLPYDENALGPTISANTMSFH
jgi:superoxide dismutase